MGIFGNQPTRLLREMNSSGTSGWTADELAQELFAILQSDEPIEISSPVNINVAGSGPGLTITNGDTSNEFPILSPPPSPPPPPGGGGGGGGGGTTTSVRELLIGFIRSVGSSTVTCAPTSSNFDAVDFEVRMPEALQGGTNQQRTVTVGSFVEQQVIVPRYEPGQRLVIAIIEEQFYDMNVDARAWAARIPGDEV